MASLFLQERSLVVTILESLFCLVILLVSLVGNILVCVAVYRNARLRYTTSIYIIALALGDLLCASVEMPLTLWTLIVGRWVFGDTVCQMQGFVDVFAASCPPAIMSLTALNRYIRIIKTNYYQKIFSPKRSKIWLVCVLSSLALYLLVARVTNWQKYDFIPGFAACSVEHFTEERKAIHYCFIVSVYFVFPISVAIYSYYQVLKNIRQHNLDVARSFQISSENEQKRISVQEIKISKSLAFVMAGFVCCWIPRWITGLTNRFLPKPVPRAVPLTDTFLIFVSCAINPFIYAVTNRAFRQELRGMLRCGVNRTHSGENNPQRARVSKQR